MAKRTRLTRKLALLLPLLESMQGQFKQTESEDGRLGILCPTANTVYYLLHNISVETGTAGEELCSHTRPSRNLLAFNY